MSKASEFFQMSVCLGYMDTKPYFPPLGIGPELHTFPRSIVSGEVKRDLLATDMVDNEENCVRLAEQMVREAFRKAREKSGTN